jgi:hypothetical protein
MELMELAKIEEMRKDDPENAKREEEIFQIKKDNKLLLAQNRSGAETAFYSANGIMANAFDPKYQQIQEALKKVSPELIRSNYAEALNIAKSIAFPGRTEKEIEEDRKRLALGTAGTPTAKAGAGNPAAPSPFSAGQSGFAGMVGAKLT